MTLNTSSPIPGLPAVACAPWCVDGTGHTDAHYPEDQVCRSETVEVELSRPPLVEVGDDSWRRDSVHLYLLRHAGASTPTVEMYRGELGESVSLALDEAEALSSALLAAVRSARD
jgi:hypothetical protein